MGISKVEIKRNGRIETLIDLSKDNVTEEALVVGCTAHTSDGEEITGKNPYKKTETDNEVTAQETLIGQILEELEGKASSGGGITPTGTKQITANGSYDISKFARVDVNVPVGITPTGTKEITENGMFDVSEFANVNVNILSGAVVKSGTTTSETINTGLSKIKQFIIWKNGVNETGLMFGSYDETGGINYTYCSAWSTSAWGGTKTFATGTTAPTINGGTVTWRGSGTQGLSSGKTYNWLAIGE